MPRPAKRIVEGLAVVTGTVVLRPGTRANKVVGRQIGMLGRHLRNRAGRLRGTSYRLRGRRPDPDVPDDVLADRIRSSLGPVEKRLDLPHLNVMVEHHVALLHGVVGTAQEADELETAVAAVSGVVGVESYLHVGIGRGDTRPSAGRLVEPPSAAKLRLLSAARAAGLDRSRPSRWCGPSWAPLPIGSPTASASRWMYARCSLRRAVPLRRVHPGRCRARRSHRGHHLGAPRRHETQRSRARPPRWTRSERIEGRA